MIPPVFLALPRSVEANQKLTFLVNRAQSRVLSLLQFHFCCEKLQHEQFGEKAVILATISDYSPYMQRSQAIGTETASHVTSTVETREKEMRACFIFYTFNTVSGPNPGNGATHKSLGLLTSISAIQTNAPQTNLTHTIPH